MCRFSDVRRYHIIKTSHISLWLWSTCLLLSWFIVANGRFCPTRTCLFHWRIIFLVIYLYIWLIYMLLGWHHIKLLILKTCIWWHRFFSFMFCLHSSFQMTIKWTNCCMLLLCANFDTWISISFYFTNLIWRHWVISCFW